MGKLIHCKDDLDKKEEIQARRIKDMLLKNNPKIVEKLKSYAMEWLKSPTEPFEMFLASKNKVLSSAYKRAKALGWKWE